MGNQPASYPSGDGMAPNSWHPGQNRRREHRVRRSSCPVAPACGSSSSPPSGWRRCWGCPKSPTPASSSTAST